MHKLKTALAALTIGFLLVASLDYMSYAATGQSLLLGRSNSADTVTQVTRTTKGPAMQFNVKDGKGAPIKVNSKGRVGKFNADMVDGEHATDLGVRTRVFTKALNVTGVNSFTLNAPGVPAGNYLVTVHGWIYGPAVATMECGVRALSTNWFAAHTWNRADADGYYSVSGAGFINVPSSSDTVQFLCLMTTGNYQTFTGSPIQVTLTSVNSATSTAFPRPALPKKVTGPSAGASR